MVATPLIICITVYFFIYWFAYRKDKFIGGLLLFIAAFLPYYYAATVHIPTYAPLGFFTSIISIGILITEWFKVGEKGARN